MRCLIFACIAVLVAAGCDKEEDPKIEYRTVYQDRIVYRDSTVYQDRIVYRDSTVYRDNYTVVSKNENDRLEISGVEWEWNESYINHLTVSGKAKNTGSITLEYVKIHVKSYDSGGALISEDYTYLKNTTLLPGNESTFNLTDYDCKNRPEKVTVGYSYSVDIFIPPAKIIFNP